MKKRSAIALMLVVVLLMTACTVNKSIDADVNVKVNGSEVVSYEFTDRDSEYIENTPEVTSEALYVEKQKVAEDTQLCDLLKTAITMALEKKEIVEADPNGIPHNQDWLYVRDIDTTLPFGDFVQLTVGWELEATESYLASSYGEGMANGVQYKMSPDNYVVVRIENSDYTGEKGKNGLHRIGTEWEY